MTCEEIVFREDLTWTSRLVDYLRDPSSLRLSPRLNPSTRLPNLRIELPSLIASETTSLLRVERRRMSVIHLEYRTIG